MNELLFKQLVEKAGVPERLQKGRVLLDKKDCIDVGRDGGLILYPEATAIELPPSPVINDIHTIWDVRKYEDARPPVKIAPLDPSVLNTECDTCVTCMPVKFPGLNEYRLPWELAHLAPYVQTIANTENQINPYAADEYYGYITFDRKTVNANGTQRGSGFHSDGVQGMRINPKREAQHTYVALNKLRTAFLNQGFDMTGIDVDKHLLNNVFSRQARLENLVFVPLNTICLFDAYSVHSGVPATKKMTRTFAKMIFSTMRFERLGNTHNHMFDYDWKMTKRPIPQNLV